MGEERQLGTHSSNLMLPVSGRRQWLIKLSCNLLASGVCGVLVFAATYFLLRSELRASWQPQNVLRSPQLLLYELCLMLLMAVPSFWAACAANGTVRAAAWTLPGLAALATAAAVAGFIGEPHWLNRAVNRFVIAVHPFPVSHGWNGLIVFPPLFYLLLAIGPVIGLALFQSYRMFRREQAESVPSVIRRLVSLWIVLLICLFSTNAVVSYIQAIYSQQGDVLAEVAQAVDNLPLDPAKIESGATTAGNVGRSESRVSTFRNSSNMAVERKHRHLSPARESIALGARAGAYRQICRSLAVFKRLRM
jgi:hypothetical protein